MKFKCSKKTRDYRKDCLIEWIDCYSQWKDLLN